MFWTGMSERFRWNLVIVVALALEPVTLYARKLGMPSSFGVTCSIAAIALSALYLFGVVRMRHHVSGSYKPGELPVLLALFVAFFLFSAVNLYFVGQ